jgi:hypothetical protein
MLNRYEFDSSANTTLKQARRWASYGKSDMIVLSSANYTFYLNNPEAELSVTRFYNNRPW